MIHHLIEFFKLGRMKGTYEIWQITNFELNSFDNPVLNYSHFLSFGHFCQKSTKIFFLISNANKTCLYNKHFSTHLNRIPEVVAQK